MSPGVREFKPPYSTQNLNREASEVHVLDNTDTMTWSLWKEARERGYVVGAWNAYGTTSMQAELMKRWYGMGWIQIADFNGDGIVDAEHDLAGAQTAIQYGITHPDVWPKVYANGDIDNDGDIDDFDNTYFTSYFYLNPSVKINFGKPKQPNL